MYKNICRFCNSEFDAMQPSGNVCEPCKNRPCEVCGKPFVHVWPYDQRACSPECRHKLRTDPANIAKKEAKRKATVQDKYGVDNVSQLKDVSEKISLSRKDPEGYAQGKLANVLERKAIVRKCILCGKEFEAQGSQTTCEGPHYKTCVVCGNKFEYKHISDKRKTCSRKCWTELRKKNLTAKERECAYCGQPFVSYSSSAKYCSGPHFATCVVCGNQFELDLSVGYALCDFPRTCSRECTVKLIQQTNIDRYGFASPHQSEEARQWFRDKSISNEAERQAKNMAKYGVRNPSQFPGVKKKISDKISSEENQAKMRRTMQERYGVDYAMQSSELAAKQRWKKSTDIACDGTRVDSQWEAAFYNFLKLNGIDFEYNTVTIPYEYEGKNHTLHVDFKVGDLLFEVKGDHLLEGFGEGMPINVKIDLYKKHHIILVCGRNVNGMFGKPDNKTSNGLKYLNKCPEPLIGVDINLFMHPAFPFAEDRPPCFYKVKVDGQLSSLQAFYDDRIRWKMIVNRINYSGGFIDSKQILKAMNVTRTCKQPSWFSKTLARRLISTYCTSETIVDPFAGWGTRYDAAIEENRSYIGLDLNPELVAWHIARGRDIKLGDANEFRFDEECSVFICPPYSDPKTGRCFEDYNFDGFDKSAKALSQCDWLKIVMINVPNAKEYVMVCKIVDEGWEQHVVETISNRSHFGSNNEYVIVVPGKQN